MTKHDGNCDRERQVVLTPILRPSLKLTEKLTDILKRVSNKSIILPVVKAVMEGVVDAIDSTGITLFDNILTACLYLGAAFQLICIFSIIILSEREDQTADDAVGCEIV